MKIRKLPTLLIVRLLGDEPTEGAAPKTAAKLTPKASSEADRDAQEAAPVAGLAPLEAAPEVAEWWDRSTAAQKNRYTMSGTTRNFRSISESHRVANFEFENAEWEHSCLFKFLGLTTEIPKICDDRNGRYYVQELRHQQNLPALHCSICFDVDYRSR